jgi:hypothetical protein
MSLPPSLPVLLLILISVLLLHQPSSPHYSGIKSVGTEGVMSDRVSRYHGFPLLTSEDLAMKLFEDLQSKLNRDKERCQSILNSLDSFPFGLTPKGSDSTVREGYRGRAMNHPDIVNLQALDGVLFNIKYLVLVRNVTVGTSSASF